MYGWTVASRLFTVRRAETVPLIGGGYHDGGLSLTVSKRAKRNAGFGGTSRCKAIDVIGPPGTTSAVDA